MDSSDAIQLLTLVILIFLSAFFSSSETALTTVNRIRIRNLAEAGDARAIILTKVIEDQGKMLSAILIGNNVVNLYASSLATTLAISVWGSKMIGVATGILTLVILVFGEITPKTLATLSAETLSLRCAKIIYGMMVVLTPVIFVVNQLSMGVLFLLRIDPNKKREAITEDELRTIVEVSHEEGVIETEEKKMINNVFDFGDSVAKDVMVPRIDMAFVDVNASYEEVIDIFRQEKYTRFPVYEETTDNVIGILNVKDILLAGEREQFSVKDYLRAPYYTYEFKKVSELMVEMKKANVNIIIVLDEYGATAGLITLEDMLEEIVGDIRDEYDEDEENELVEIAANEYVVEGSMKLDDLNDRLELKLESEDYDSVGGLVIGLLDHLPEEGEDVVFDNVRLVVDRVEKNRIDRIHLYILNPVQAVSARMKEEEERREEKKKSAAE
ncbi:MAG: HlyC/CorC family transporter [Hungatella hathewayi]|nr:HlyC/CorC family transporter [Hungatella hathewayi]